ERASRDGRPFEVALLDFKMPQMNGIELAHAIRERPALRSLSMVMLSSAHVESERLSEANVSAFLSKPARQSDLYNAIVDAVAGAPARTDPASPARSAAEPSRTPEPDSPIVLVAEDNEVNRAVAKALLAKRGLRSAIAHNGVEAVKMAGENDYAAIL